MTSVPPFGHGDGPAGGPGPGTSRSSEPPKKPAAVVIKKNPQLVAARPPPALRPPVSPADVAGPVPSRSATVRFDHTLPSLPSAPAPAPPQSAGTAVSAAGGDATAASRVSAQAGSVGGGVSGATGPSAPPHLSPSPSQAARSQGTTSGPAHTGGSATSSSSASAGASPQPRRAMRRGHTRSPSPQHPRDRSPSKGGAYERREHLGGRSRRRRSRSRGRGRSRTRSRTRSVDRPRRRSPRHRSSSRDDRRHPRGGRSRSRSPSPSRGWQPPRSWGVGRGGTPQRQARERAAKGAERGGAGGGVHTAVGPLTTGATVTTPAPAPAPPPVAFLPPLPTPPWLAVALRGAASAAETERRARAIHVATSSAARRAAMGAAAAREAASIAAQAWDSPRWCVRPTTAHWPEDGGGMESNVPQSLRRLVAASHAGHLTTGTKLQRRAGGGTGGTVLLPLGATADAATAGEAAAAAALPRATLADEVAAAEDRAAVAVWGAAQAALAAAVAVATAYRPPGATALWSSAEIATAVGRGVMDPSTLCVVLPPAGAVVGPEAGSIATAGDVAMGVGAAAAASAAAAAAATEAIFAVGVPPPAAYHPSSACWGYETADRTLAGPFPLSLLCEGGAANPALWGAALHYMPPPGAAVAAGATWAGRPPPETGTLATVRDVMTRLQGETTGGDIPTVTPVQATPTPPVGHPRVDADALMAPVTAALRAALMASLSSGPQLRGRACAALEAAIGAVLPGRVTVARQVKEEEAGRRAAAAAAVESQRRAAVAEAEAAATIAREAAARDAAAAAAAAASAASARDAAMAAEAERNRRLGEQVSRLKAEAAARATAAAAADASTTVASSKRSRGTGRSPRAPAAHSPPPPSPPPSPPPPDGSVIIGRRVSVLWPVEDYYFPGVIGSYSPVSRTHVIQYDDGEDWSYVLSRQVLQWEGETPVLPGPPRGPAHVPSCVAIREIPPPLGAPPIQLAMGDDEGDGEVGGGATAAADDGDGGRGDDDDDDDHDHDGGVDSDDDDSGSDGGYTPFSPGAKRGREPIDKPRRGRPPKTLASAVAVAHKRRPPHTPPPPEVPSCARSRPWIGRRTIQSAPPRRRRGAGARAGAEEVITEVDPRQSTVVAVAAVTNGGTAVGGGRKARAEARRYAGEAVAAGGGAQRRARLRFDRSKIHAWGLFALAPIPKDDLVAEYTGERIRASVSDVRERRYEDAGIDSSYLFRVDREDVVDATVAGGMARYINHCCDPNAASRIFVSEGKRCIGIFAKRAIAVGEEVTYDYKFPIEAVKIPCHCGAALCRGALN